MGFICSACGRLHEGDRRDIAFALPDVVWQLPVSERQRHIEWSTELCFYQNQWYMRGILHIPLNFEEGSFGWGLWAAVPDLAVKAYSKVMDADGSKCKPEKGTLANSIKGYPKTLELPVKIQFGTATQRPTFTVDPYSGHPLVQEQQYGISCKRLAELISKFGG